MKTRIILMIMVINLFYSFREVFAYVDPGSGGYLFQILFMAFSAMIGFLAIGKEKAKQIILFPWRLLKKLFSSSKNNKNNG